MYTVVQAPKQTFVLSLSHTHTDTYKRVHPNKIGEAFATVEKLFPNKYFYISLTYIYSLYCSTIKRNIV